MTLLFLATWNNWIYIVILTYHADKRSNTFRTAISYNLNTKDAQVSLIIPRETILFDGVRNLDKIVFYGCSAYDPANNRGRKPETNNCKRQVENGIFLTYRFIVLRRRIKKKITVVILSMGVQLGTIARSDSYFPDRVFLSFRYKSKSGPDDDDYCNAGTM